MWCKWFVKRLSLDLIVQAPLWARCLVVKVRIVWCTQEIIVDRTIPALSFHCWLLFRELIWPEWKRAAREPDSSVVQITHQCLSEELMFGYQ